MVREYAGTFPPYHRVMLIYCCCDLIFSTRIAATAGTLGIASRPARDAESLRKRLARVDDGKLNDAVTALIVDLSLGEVGLNLIRQAKAHSPALPVVAFGSHVDVQALEAARQAGAEFVMPRSQFAANLPAILERLAGKTV